MSLLHLAVLRGYTDGVKQLLYVGRCDVNCKDERTVGLTPLHVAVRTGNAGMVKLLVDSGADVNVEDLFGLTPLHWVAYRGQEDIVKLLLEFRADPNITDKDCRTPLHEAAKEGRENTVKLLLERGADPNITDKDKLTPYALAVKRNHEHIKIMLQRFSMPSNQTHLLQKVITVVSEEISVRDTRSLARMQLGIPKSKLENIRCQNPNDAQEEAFQILWEWMKTKAGATVHNLFKALKDQQLNACLDKVMNEYASFLNEIWSKPEDEFLKFSSSLQRTKSSTDVVMLSNMTEMNLRCHVSGDLESLYVPLFNANAKGNNNDSVKTVVKYRFAGKGIFRGYVR